MGMALSRTDWTAADLAKAPDDGLRREIIDGVLYVTPSPSGRHQDVLGALYETVRAYAEPLGLVVRFAPYDIGFSERTVVEPDLIVLPRRADGLRPDLFGEVSSLVLAVEILSPGTKHRDRGVKRRLYQAQGVPEYWIVDLQGRAVERWRPESTTAEVMRAELHWKPSPAAEPLCIDLSALFHAALDT